ncbi:MAG: hypothetical protein ACLQBD_26945 [Syntrophobacteraceae bacterium]
MSGKVFSPKELAYGGLFGASALLLPVIFHLVHLGHIFMPMYLPLVALAFFVRPLPAALTALIVPLLSGAATGMPPFYPPVAVIMAVELAIMAAVIAAIKQYKPKWNERVILVPTLILGRIVNVGLIYLFAGFIDLPAGFVAGASFISALPGIILILAVVPPLVRLATRQKIVPGPQGEDK